MYQVLECLFGLSSSCFDGMLTERKQTTNELMNVIALFRHFVSIISEAAATATAWNGTSSIN